MIPRDPPRHPLRHILCARRDIPAVTVPFIPPYSHCFIPFLRLASALHPDPYPIRFLCLHKSDGDDSAGERVARTSVSVN